MSEIDFTTEHENQLTDYLGRDKTRGYITGIVSKREKLRELRYAVNEGSNVEKLEEEFRELLIEINDLVGNLGGAMEQDGFDLRPVKNNFGSAHDNHWSLGSEEIRHPLIPFLRGNLEPIQRVIVAPNLSENVVALFLIIPSLRETLERENHGHWGYHYHYLDAKKRRSDTLLTFDRKLKTLHDGQKVKVVKWEKHSEANHFKARAATWGDKKRQSVHDACVGDSAKRSLNNFKKPAKDAETLWPV